MLSGLTEGLKRYVPFKPNDENEAVNKKRPLSCDADTSHGNYGAQKRQKLSPHNFTSQQEFDEPLNYFAAFCHWVTDIPNHNYFIQRIITALKYPFERKLSNDICSLPARTDEAMKLSSKRGMLRVVGNDKEQTEGKLLTRASLRSTTRRQIDYTPIERRSRRTPTKEKDVQSKLDYSDRSKGKHFTSTAPKGVWQNNSSLSNGISNNDESWEALCQKRPRESKSSTHWRAFTAEESVRLHEKEQYKMLLQQFTTESIFRPYQRSPVCMKDAQVQSDFPWSTKDNKHHYPPKIGSSVIRKDKLNHEETCSLIKLLKSNPKSSYEVSRSKDCFIVSSIEKKPHLSTNIQAEKPRKEKIQTTNDDDSIVITKVEPPTKLIPTTSKHKDTSFFSPKWLEELRQTISAQGQKFVEASKREEEKLSLMREKRQAAHAKEEEEIKERLRRKNVAVLEEGSENDEDQLADFPELTPEMDAAVDDALRTNPPDEVLAEGFRLSVARRDMETLAGLNWLNDEIINFYMNLLMERSKLDNFPTVYAFNTFFYTKLLNSGHGALRRWTRKVDIFSYDMLLVPVHMGMHWCLAVIDFRHKRIQYYDSMGGQNAECLNALKTYLQDERMDKKKEDFDMSGWTLETVKNIPHQMNGSDCGMFALKYAEYITRDAKINFLQNHMPYFRRRMVYEILTKRLL